MTKNKVNIKELQDLLDSDDELPTKFTEEPDLPAYLDDHRFDKIQFNWLNNDKIRKIPANQPVKTIRPPATPVKPLVASAPVHNPSHATQKENIPAAKQKCDNKNLIKKGILKEEDILCMKSVAARTTDDEALLWFIDFLMYKDLQSDYRFLKSCLVISPENYGKPRTNYSQISCPEGLKYCFELVVK